MRKKRTRLSRRILNLLMTLVLVPCLPLQALAGEVNTGYFGQVAIEGYDPVAYFTLNRPVKGSQEHTVKWLGATWLFSSGEHRRMFETDPFRYAPQYGGYCADGIAYGTRTANIDPEAWRIIDDKLYLNYDHGAAKEIEEIPGQIARADANWPEIRQALTED